MRPFPEASKHELYELRDRLMHGANTLENEADMIRPVFPHLAEKREETIDSMRQAMHVLEEAAADYPGR